MINIYLLPNIEEILDFLENCKYFTSLHVASDYYQIKIQELSNYQGGKIQICSNGNGLK